MTNHPKLPPKPWRVVRYNTQFVEGFRPVDLVDAKDQRILRISDDGDDRGLASAFEAMFSAPISGPPPEFAVAQAVGGLQFLADNAADMEVASIAAGRDVNVAETCREALEAIRKLETWALDSALSDRLDAAGSPLTWKEVAQAAETERDTAVAWASGLESIIESLSNLLDSSARLRPVTDVTNDSRRQGDPE